MADENEDYLRCKFSITCYTEDLAVVHCLRALCHYAEIAVPPQIAWGGTTVKSWANSDKKIKLRLPVLITETLLFEKHRGFSQPEVGKK